jgi:hypothetical protein
MKRSVPPAHDDEAAGPLDERRTDGGEQPTHLRCGSTPQFDHDG